MSQLLLNEKALLSGDVRSLGKCISAAEDRDLEVWELLAKNYSRLGKSTIVGVTGPPGAGKSTLLGKMIGVLRRQGRKVGILAVDPVSPFSHGALLGDRIRLSDHFNDPGVFIRSVSTRGRLGGLSLATREATHLMDLAGFDWVFVETVGVGQSEVDVRRLVDLTVVVVVPESGDDIQAFKGGILEIGQILVVNKADRKGAAQLATFLRDQTVLAGRSEVDVVETRYDQTESAEALFDCISKKVNDKAFLGKRRRDRLLEEKIELLESWVSQSLRSWLGNRNLPLTNPYEEALAFVKVWSLPGANGEDSRRKK